MFYELDTQGAFVCDSLSNEGLSDWTTTPPPQPCDRPRMEGDKLESGEWIGGWVDDGPAPLNSESLEFVERLWRDGELKRADIELNKVQDGVGVGTVSAWRTYRCLLRDWPENEHFPDASKRPVGPDAL